MAIFRPGAIVGAISGSINGATFVHGPNGAVIRNRPQRAAPKGPGIEAMQSSMNQLQTEWADLTDDQRLSWRTAATDYDRKNRLGLASPLTGHQLFLKVNLEMHSATEPFFSTPSVNGTSEGPRSFSVALSASGDLDWLADPPQGSSIGIFISFARLVFTPTPPRNVSKLVFLHRHLGTELDRDMRTEIEAIFGIPVVGQTMLCGCAATSGKFYMGRPLTLIETVGA